MAHRTLTTHSAPQVAYPLGRSAYLGAALIAVWALGALAVSFWIYSELVIEGRSLVAGAAVALAGLAAARGWYTAPIGHLTWDGQVWRWQSAGYSTGESALALSVALDLQRVLWLRLENSDGACLWLWAEKSALPYRWMDLRRAVAASADANAAPLASAL